MSQLNVIHSIKNEVKNTLSLGLPLVASQLVYACSGFIGTAMVAHLGENALAASVLVSMTWMCLSVLFFGILNASSILVSQQYGAKNNSAISKIMGQSYILGFIIMFILMIILSCLPYALHLSHQPARVLEIANQYVTALIWTVPGLIILIVSEQFLAAVGKSRIVLRISLLIVPIEIPIIYAFIFGKAGLPACGVAGVGYGFAVTYTITAIGLLIYLAKSKHYQQFAIFAKISKIDFTYLYELIRVGLPMGFMHVIELSAFSLGTFWIGHFGTTILAAHQIALQYLGFSITLVFAVSQAVTIRVGHMIGERDATGAKYASFTGIFLCLLCTLIIALVFGLYPEMFLRLDMDINDKMNFDLINDSSMLFKIFGVLLIFDTIRIIGFGALRGLKDTRFPMLAAFIGFWMVGITSAYWLAFHLQLAGKGVWWGLTLGIIAGSIIVIARLLHQLRNIDVEKILKIGKSHSH